MKIVPQLKIVLLIIFIIMIAIVSFLQILTSEKQILSGMIFVLFMIISVFLIKYSIRAARAEKYVEEEVEKQIKGIVLSKQKLRDRITDLKKDEQSLEKELSQMEQWYDATVKRELEMIELKKKIKGESK